MDAREYLSQVKSLRSKINHKRKQLIDKKYNTVMGGTMTGDAERVQRSPSLSAPYEDKIIEIADLTRQIEQDILSYQLVLNEIVDTIHKIDETVELSNVKDKSVYMDVLYDKWIEGKSLEQISVMSYRSFDHIRHIYWNGMKAVQEVLDTGMMSKEADGSA